MLSGCFISGPGTSSTRYVCWSLFECTMGLLHLKVYLDLKSIRTGIIPLTKRTLVLLPPWSWTLHALTWLYTHPLDGATVGALSR